MGKQKQTLQAKLDARQAEHQRLIQQATHREAELRATIADLQAALRPPEPDHANEQAFAVITAQRDALQHRLTELEANHQEAIQSLQVQLRNAKSTAALVEAQRSKYRAAMIERDALARALSDTRVHHETALGHLQADLETTQLALAACREASTMSRILPAFAPLAAAGLPAAHYNERDDLQRIKGVGPFLEQKLHDFGIYTFRQIAAMTPTVIDKLGDTFGSFCDRIGREAWVRQAKALHAEMHGEVL
ncbi:MAG: hypothetical protein RhofKO_11770 [Rhodothermales bacterium]